MPPSPSPAVPREWARPIRAFSIPLVVLLAAAGVAIVHPQFSWILANLLLIGLPALIAVTVLRECVRIGVAHAFGFELFGVQWGAGQSRFRFRIGQVHHRISPIPIGGDARFASSRPTHHRLARWSLAIVPLLFQLLAAVLVARLSESSFAMMRDTWAPLIVLHLANIMLLGVHLFVPFRTTTGLCSDLEIISVLALSGTDEHRASRATAYTMQIERLLESTQLDLAELELTKAIKQLGREPMLIQLENRIARIKSAPDPRSAAHEDGLSDPFDHPWSVWDREVNPRSLVGRVTQRTLGFVPMVILAVAFVGFQIDTLLSSVHARWTSEARGIARASDEEACREQLAILDSRRERVASLVRIPRELQIRELRARAALHACSRNFERATRDQALAVQIADSLRSAPSSSPRPDSGDPVQAELVHSSELRQLAAWHLARGAYRDALRATARAAEELNTADLAASNWPPSPERTRARNLFEREREVVESTRARIIEGMGVRG